MRLIPHEFIQVSLSFFDPFLAAHYPLLDLSHDERTLLERSIQQVNTMVKQVSQIIVPLFAITNDEHELWEVAKAVSV